MFIVFQAHCDLDIKRGAQQELSVALVQSQGYVYRSCALLLAKASGRQVLPGADAPLLD
jgi:hypothetical protein